MPETLPTDRTVHARPDWLSLARRDERMLLGVFLFVLAAHAVASLVAPNYGPWGEGQRVGAFLLHLGLGLVGLWLIAFPLSIVTDLIAGDHGLLPDPIYSLPFVAAVLAGVVVAASFKRVPAWRRGVWAYLIMAVLSQFAALQYSTLGN